MKPKAIFICGPAGSGKSTLVKYILKYSDEDIISLNVDDFYEDILKNTYHLDLNIALYNSIERSQAASAMQASRKSLLQAEVKAIQSKKNILLDGTGGSSKVILGKKKNLEDNGYDVMMIGIWAEPAICLERNTNRERMLKPSVVLRSWKDVMSNLDEYYLNFDNFHILRGSDVCEKYKPTEIKKDYFDTIHIGDISYTHEELESKEKEMDELHQYVVKNQDMFLFDAEESDVIITQILKFINDDSRPIPRFI